MLSTFGGCVVVVPPPPPPVLPPEACAVVAPVSAIDAVTAIVVRWVRVRRMCGSLSGGVNGDGTADPSDPQRGGWEGRFATRHRSRYLAGPSTIVHLPPGLPLADGSVPVDGAVGHVCLLRAHPAR